MQKSIYTSVLVVAVASFSIAALAAKPVAQNEDGSYTWNGNNYPSGAHFNLNIHGKKDAYVCSEPKFQWTIISGPDDTIVGTVIEAEACPEGYACTKGDQVFGNVINVPRVGSDIGILIESGSKGPKGKPAATELEVTDWCSAELDGDDASLRLPKDSDGYIVMARITGKPGDGDGASVKVNGCLAGAADESGNDMVMLGLVSTNGDSFVPDCTDAVSGEPQSSDDIVLTRIRSGGGKGAKKATNITRLFEWSGEVCYLQEDVSAYCGVDSAECSSRNLCCVDTDGSADGVYERCDTLDEVGVLQPDLSVACPVLDADGFAYTAIQAQCQTYTDDWVFNIADFVDYLWGLDNDGSYNIKVRFYPLSEQAWWPLPVN
jgi:hypothetical protein